MARKFSDNEQKNFIMAVDHLYARIHRLRDVANENNWDRDLSKAWREFAESVNDAIPAYSHLQ